MQYVGRAGCRTRAPASRRRRSPRRGAGPAAPRLASASLADERDDVGIQRRRRARLGVACRHSSRRPPRPPPPRRAPAPSARRRRRRRRRVLAPLDLQRAEAGADRGLERLRPSRRRRPRPRRAAPRRRPADAGRASLPALAQVAFADRVGDQRRPAARRAPASGRIARRRARAHRRRCSARPAGSGDLMLKSIIPAAHQRANDVIRFHFAQGARAQLRRARWW